MPRGRVPLSADRRRVDNPLRGSDFAFRVEEHAPMWIGEPVESVSY
jgi:hypothetical protein